MVKRGSETTHSVSKTSDPLEERKKVNVENVIIAYRLLRKTVKKEN